MDGRPLRTGMLLKQGHVVKSWKERLFVLVHDKLCYYDLPPTHSPDDLHGVTPLGVIRLSDVKAVAATRNRSTFKVTVAANPASGQIEREYLLVAATDKERDDWLAALRRAIFSPGRAAEILRTAMDMQRDGRLCRAEIEQIKQWLKVGSDGELSKAASLVSDATQRDPTERASDACESLLIDFKAAALETDFLNVLSKFRTILREEDEQLMQSGTRTRSRAVSGGLQSGGSSASLLAANTGGGASSTPMSAPPVPTDSFRERLLECAMEHIAYSSEVTEVPALEIIPDGSPTLASASPAPSGQGSKSSSAQPSPMLSAAVSSSWLPSFLSSSSAGTSTASIDGSKGALDRANSRSSTTIGRSDSSTLGTGQQAGGGQAPAASASIAPVRRWTPEVQEAFGLVLHQIAMRIVIAEERKEAAAKAKEVASATATTDGIASSGTGTQTQVQDAAGTSAPGTDTAEPTLAVPSEPVVVPSSEGGGEAAAQSLSTAIEPETPVVDSQQESLDDMLERYGLADDLRRLQRARVVVASSPAGRAHGRSRGESAKTAGSDGAGTPTAARKESDMQAGSVLEEEDEDAGVDAAPSGEGTAAYLRGPTARARAATAASVKLYRTLSQAGALKLDRKALHAAKPVNNSTRHSEKVAAAAAEAAVSGFEASVLRIDPNDPDPCATLREEEPFSEVYQLGDKIGEGAYSIVYRGIHRASGESIAVKVAKKGAMTAVEQRRLLEEVRIMSALDHDHIVRLHAFHADKDAYYIVSELCTGGELFDKIVTRSSYSEREAREVVRTIAEAVAYMHAHGVVHRDLKPENVLLSSPDDETAIIRIADLGFAKVVPRGAAGADGVPAKGFLRTSCGTPSYVAPEILEGRPYDEAVDLWSLGVIAYILLAGYAPFHARNQTELFRSIVAGRYYFDSPYWDGVSTSAKDLIKRLLMVDPSKRLTAEQVLQHRWLQGTVSAVELTSAVQQLRVLQSSRRHVLKRGELTKRGAIFWSWRKRTFVLTSETLEYYDSAEYADGGNPLARPKGVISLKDVESVRTLDGAAAASVQAPPAEGAGEDTLPASSSGSDRACLFTVNIGGGRQYVCAASSEAERTEWVRAISSARAHSDLVRKALMAKEAHADTDLVALMKLAATWKELVGLPQDAQDVQDELC